MARRADRPAPAAAEEARRGCDRSRRAHPACGRSPRCSPTPAACFRARPCSARSRISSRPTARRCTGCAVRLGPLDVFLPLLLKPAAQYWRAALLAVRTGQPMPALPARRRRDPDAEADPRGAALAYRRLGRDWLRIDLADRLASHARKVRSAGGDDPVDAELATSVGLDRRCDRPADGRESASPGPATPGAGAAAARRATIAIAPASDATPSPNWRSSGARS